MDGKKRVSMGGEANNPRGNFSYDRLLDILKANEFFVKASRFKILIVRLLIYTFETAQTSVCFRSGNRLCSLL